MICQIAVATSTAPGQWWTEDDDVIATVIDVLREQAEEAER